MVNMRCNKDMDHVNKCFYQTIGINGYLQSTQVFEEVPADHPESDGVGRPIVHRSARQQATGEALFIDDTPHYESK